MSLQVTKSEDGAELLIRFPDRFDFSCHGEFRQSYESAESCECYVLDMRDTSYMDSSALGLLLQLREYAGGNSEAVKIVNAQPGIREILNIASFGKLMTIE